jgi:hypothetical protein
MAQAHAQDYQGGYSLACNNAINNIAIDIGEFNYRSDHWQRGHSDGWSAEKASVSGNTQQIESSGINIGGARTEILSTQENPVLKAI